jgi:hypothetical protein
MRTLAIVTFSLLVFAGSPATAQTSERLGVEQLRVKYPRKQRVYATGAKASSSYGRGYMASEVVGPPNVFPRFKDGKNAWACKDKRSNAEWLEVTFPPTKAKALIVFETWKPDGITKILIGDTVVYKAGAYRRRGKAQGLCVEFGGVLTITKVRIELNPTRVSYYPEIDAVALVPAGGATPPPSGGPKPLSGGPKPPAAGGAVQANVTKALVLIAAVEKGYPALKNGDVPAANVLLKKIKAANDLLGACTDRSASAWRDAYRRSRAVDANIRSVAARRPAAGSTPTAKRPTAGGAEQPNVTKARVLIAAAEKGASTLKDGDVPAANLLLGKIKKAFALLTACPDRSRPAFKQAVKRAETVQTKILASARRRPGAGSTPTAETPPASTSNSDDEKGLVKGRSMLDAIETKLASLKAGDVGARDALQAEFNSVHEVLKRCRFRHRKTYHAELRRYSRLTDKMSNAFDGLDPEKLAIKAMGPPTSRGPAIGEAVSFDPEMFGMRTGAEVLVFATGAVASSSYAKGGGYSSAQATGAPNVFPEYIRSKNSWAPHYNDTHTQWLEVAFPKTLTRCV